MTKSQLIHAHGVYIAQSRATKHRGFAFTLLGWAAKARRELSASLFQKELFPTPQTTATLPQQPKVKK